MKKQPDINDLRFAVLASDILLLCVRGNELLARLIAVESLPSFRGMSGLPGGLLKPLETAEQTVKRLLVEKAGVAPGKVYLEQLYTFSGVKRDPRGRVVSVAYLGLVAWDNLSVREQQDSEKAFWCPLGKIKKLAYDHNQILEMGLKRLSSKISYSTLAAKLLPAEFTLTELQQLYQLIWHKPLDKRNFRKKMLQWGVLRDTGKKRLGLKARPSRLYRFNDDRVVDVVSNVVVS